MNGSELKSELKLFAKAVSSLNNLINEQQAEIDSLQDSVESYRESLKADQRDAIEIQEQQEREDFNEGREVALSYALEMLEKHFPCLPQKPPQE